MYASRSITQLVLILAMFFCGCNSKDQPGNETSGTLNQVNQSGERTGPWEIYADSVLISRGSYVNGKPDGLWTVWYPNGQMKEEGNYLMGVKHGMWVEWYEDGEIMWKGEWENGTRHIDNRGAGANIYFIGLENPVDALARDSEYRLRIRIQNIPSKNLFVELSSGEITQVGESDLFILKTSSDTLVTMAVGYIPDLQFRDFRNLVSEIEFTCK